MLKVRLSSLVMTFCARCRIMSWVCCSSRVLGREVSLFWSMCSCCRQGVVPQKSARKAGEVVALKVEGPQVGHGCKRVLVQPREPHTVLRIMLYN